MRNLRNGFRTTIDASHGQESLEPPLVSRSVLKSAGLCGVLMVLVGGPLAGLAQEPKPTEGPRLDGLVPRWEAGDRWVVETVSRPLHVRAEASPTVYAPPLRWQFDVSPSKKPLSKDCFCVEVRCEGDVARTAKTVFWLDRNSFSLRQITICLPIVGGFEEMTMSYDSGSGQPAPILGPLSALPIDTPMLYAGTKGMQTFSYTSYCGARERKELGDIGFAHQVEQEILEVPQDEVARLLSQHFTKSLVEDPFAKSLTDRPVTEVRLKSQGREIRQLWQANRPWPIYCDNGYTVSRLVSVDRKEGQP